jgi:hypothetical protein
MLCGGAGEGKPMESMAAFYNRTGELNAKDGIFYLNRP